MSSSTVKTRREDFVVDELTQYAYQRADGLNVQHAGPHAVYQLKKSGIGTLEAANVVLQQWNLARSSLGYAGRKDRHAITSQLITLRDGPPESIEERTFSVRYVGQAKKAITAENLVGNQFEIVLRNLSPQDRQRIEKLLGTDQPYVPNYFDEQRFGSVGSDGELAAVPWCLGDYEQAAFIALAADNPRDSKSEREQRSILRDHWGDWLKCKELLDRSNRRSVITYLVDHPEGFKKAVALIHRDQRSLYVSALQSKIWNEVVSRWLSQRGSATAFYELSTIGGLLRFPLNGSAGLHELTDARIPLPSSRPTKWTGLSQATEGTVKQILTEVCREMDLEPHRLRFSHPRDVFFSRAQRPVLQQLKELEFEFAEDDLAHDAPGDLENGCPQKLTLKFKLGPGQYATLLLKALQNTSSTGD